MNGPVGEMDREYADRWRAWQSGGKLEGSRLVDEDRTAHAVSYTVVLAPGRNCFDEAFTQREHIAGALGVASRQLLFERALWLNDAGRFRLTIIEDEIVTARRLAREPRVRHGVLRDPGRFVDGRGDFVMTMWSAERGRTVPVTLVGDPGSGRSNALRQLACGALSTGAMHVLLVDPSGIREPELREHARVALVGEQAARRVWSVLDAISAQRRRLVQARGTSHVLPSQALPGWMVVFAEVGLTMAQDGALDGMTRLLRDSDRLGLWRVAVGRSTNPSEWGNVHIRTDFKAQTIAFVPSEWSVMEMGVDVLRAAVPTDTVGCALAGFGRRANVSMRWDWQPGCGDAVIDEDEIVARDVIARYRQDAPVDVRDGRAIAAVLGEPVAGRWVVTA